MSEAKWKSLYQELKNLTDHELEVMIAQTEK